MKALLCHLTLGLALIALPLPSLAQTAQPAEAAEAGPGPEFRSAFDRSPVTQPQSLMLAPEEEKPKPLGGVRRQPADDPFAKTPEASVALLARAYLKLSGSELTDDALIDDFASLEYCNLMTRFYSDEFYWRKARDAIRAKIEKDRENFVEELIYKGRVEMASYDFDAQKLMMSPSFRFEKLGQFRITMSAASNCLRRQMVNLPIEYNVRLMKPISLDGIPMDQKTAYDLTRHMQKTNNKNRVVYISFRFNVNNFVKSVSQPGIPISAVARARLTGLRFYSDPERRIILYDHPIEEQDEQATPPKSVFGGN